MLLATCFVVLFGMNTLGVHLESQRQYLLNYKNSTGESLAFKALTLFRKTPVSESRSPIVTISFQITFLSKIGAFPMVIFLWFQMI